jgi:hypothetical protein
LGVLYAWHQRAFCAGGFSVLVPESLWPEDCSKMALNGNLLLYARVRNQTVWT